MNRLQQLRLDALKTPEELSKETGVSVRTIYRLEEGKGAQVKTLKALSECFGVPASTLLLPAVVHVPERDAA